MGSELRTIGARSARTMDQHPGLEQGPTRLANLLMGVSIGCLVVAGTAHIVAPQLVLDSWFVLFALTAVSLSGALGRHRNDLSMRTMFFVALLLFGALGGGLTQLDSYQGDLDSISEELLLLTLSGYVIWLVTRRGGASEPRPMTVASPEVRGGRRAQLVPVVLLAPSSIIAYLTANEFTVAAQLSSALLFALIVYAAMIARGLRRYSITQLFVLANVGVAAFVYVAFVFGGGGRLKVLSLAFAIIWTTMRDSRFGKRNLVLLITIVGLPFAGAIEQTRTGAGAFSIEEIGLSADGLVSVASPLVSFDDIVSEEGSPFGNFEIVTDRPQALGETFVVAAAAPIPRTVWPDKPVGFGRLLVEHYDPNLAALASNLSHAATYLGEWVYGFGIAIGLVGGSVVVALLIRVADRSRVRYSRGVDARSLALHTAHVLLAANLANYVWGGLQTYAIRGIYPALAVLVVFRLRNPLNAARS